jgi:hypothetical protein
MLKGPDAIIPLRSLWILGETKTALVDSNLELNDLYEAASAKSQQAIIYAIDALDRKPDDERAYAQAFFAALAARSDRPRVARALPLLTQKLDSHLRQPAILAQVLLGNSDEMNRELLKSLATSDVEGDDLVVLTALACYRNGAETQSAFQAEAGRLLGSQPLSGIVVVLVNRLTRSPLVTSMARAE